MSKPSPALTRPLILSAALASALLLSGCTAIPSAPQIKLTESQRAPCPTPADEPLATQGDDDALDIRTAMLLVACSREKIGLVQVIDAFNEAVKPKRWWKVW